VFDTFVPVVCVLTMEIFWGCTSLFYEWGGSGARGSSRRICHCSTTDMVQTYGYFTNISDRPGTLKEKAFIFLHWIYEVITKFSSDWVHTIFICICTEGNATVLMEFTSRFSQLLATTGFCMRSRDGSRCKNNLSHCLPF
jgi:hypothetical protein